MAEEQFTTQQLRARRRVTRAVADLLRGELREYLATLAPLFRPRAVLGNHAESGTMETVKGADAALKELQSLFQTISAAKPFSLPKEELRQPIGVVSSAPEITSVEYAHTIRGERESKTLTVTKPLQWILNYSGFGPKRLQELLADRNRNQSDVRAFVVHYLALHLVVTRQAGLAKILDALHFPISTGRLPGCGDLPITFVSSLTTALPPDDVVLESTELSGMAVFEEVVNPSTLSDLRDPLREQLAAIISRQDSDGPAS
ncbi:MAG TPA: hypothetical protein VGG61_10475 [Gemmataceae bacterium]